MLLIVQINHVDVMNLGVKSKISIIINLCKEFKAILVAMTVCRHYLYFVKLEKKGENFPISLVNNFGENVG